MSYQADLINAYRGQFAVIKDIVQVMDEITWNDCGGEPWRWNDLRKVLKEVEDLENLLSHKGNSDEDAED